MSIHGTRDVQGGSRGAILFSYGVELDSVEPHQAHQRTLCSILPSLLEKRLKSLSLLKPRIEWRSLTGHIG